MTEASPDAPPAEQLERQELAAAIDAAVAQLPVEQREVFLLRQQGVSFKEIGRIQETTVNTALGRM